MTVQTKITSYEIGRRLEKKDPRLGLQPSAPCDKYARWDYINIFQINTDGIQGKKEELKKALIDNDVRIALIQETQLPKTESFRIPGYTTYKCECSIKCRGILSLIRNDTQAEVENIPSGDIDIQKVTAWFENTKYTFYNIYWPNYSKTELPFAEATFKRCILAGDFNAHMPILGYPDYNFRGREVEDLLNSSNLILEQDMDSAPTLLHKRHGTNSKPDLSIISADIYEQTTVEVMDGMGSDHDPLLIKIKKNRKNQRLRERPSGTTEKPNGLSMQGLLMRDLKKLTLPTITLIRCQLISVKPSLQLPSKLSPVVVLKNTNLSGVKTSKLLSMKDRRQEKQ